MDDGATLLPGSISTSWLSLLALLLLLLAHPVQAGSSGKQQSASVSFDFYLPATTLSEALEQFSRLTGIAVAIDPRYMRRKTVVVQGQMDPMQALDKLVQGSGLHVRRLASDSVVITMTSRPVSPQQLRHFELAGLDASNLVHRRYAARLQAALIAGLCNVRVTRPGSYRLALQLQINEQGRVARHKRLDTTGNALRDQRIDNILMGLYIGAPPPAGLAQPVLIVILPSGGGVQAHCFGTGAP